MDDLAIGIVGFGEAGFHIANGLRAAGLTRLFAYDVNAQTRLLGERIRQRAHDSQAVLLDSNDLLAQASLTLLSTVTANRAIEAAEQNAPFLGPGHLYADLNSVSPVTKQSIAAIITARGARFVEAAVMAPVPPYGHRVPMLLGGVDAPALVSRLAPYGMCFEVLSDRVGSAAAVKMFRSIIVKGLEALLFECVLGASRYGAEQRVFASLGETFPGIDWSQLASYMIGRVVVHGERRAREMEEVAETLRDLDIEPFMAEATVKRMDWCAQLNLSSLFREHEPKDYQQVLDAIASVGEYSLKQA